MGYHVCIIRKEEDFRPGSFRAMVRYHDGKKYDVFIAKLKKRDAMAEQSFQYLDDIWTEEESREH